MTLQRTPIHRIYPIYHLNRLESGKDNSSSEAHRQSSKTRRGFYLDPVPFKRNFGISVRCVLVSEVCGFSDYLHFVLQDQTPV